MYGAMQAIGVHHRLTSNCLCLLLYKYQPRNDALPLVMWIIGRITYVMSDAILIKNVHFRIFFIICLYLFYAANVVLLFEPTKKILPRCMKWQDCCMRWKEQGFLCFVLDFSYNFGFAEVTWHSAMKRKSGFSFALHSFFRNFAAKTERYEAGDDIGGRSGYTAETAD